MSAAEAKSIRLAPAPKDRTRKDRSNEPRDPRGLKSGWKHQDPIPAAGAHALRHLVNEDATPGAGALPSFVHRFGKEVDGAAG